MAKSQNKKDGTVIVSCGCRSDYQDGVYGVGKRVANRTKKTPGNIARCSVCGKEISI